MIPVMLLSEPLFEGALPLQGDFDTFHDEDQDFRPVIITIQYPDSQKILVGFRIWNWGWWYKIEHEGCWFESGLPTDEVKEKELRQARTLAARVIADSIGEDILENDNYRPTEWD